VSSAVGLSCMSSGKNASAAISTCGISAEREKDGGAKGMMPKKRRILLNRLNKAMVHKES
jgi:hypothetical protein